MTIEQMDDVIQDYCGSCSECKIKELCEKVHGDFEGNPEICKQAYDIITVNPVSHPSHYTQGNIQCIEAMESAFGKEAVAIWCKLNAFKYIWREEHKNGIQDIDKAIWYLNKYKELKSSE